MKPSATRMLALAALFALPLGGCGNGDQFDVTINGTHENYNKGASGRRADRDPTTTTIAITGYADPVASAVDDEYNDILHLEFDRAGLDALPRGSALPISGTTHMTGLTDGGGTGNATITFEPAAGDAHTAAITGVWFERSCFCGNLNPTADQHFTGTITLDDAGNGALRVRTDLALDGSIPQSTNQNAHTTIVADVVADYPQQ